MRGAVTRSVTITALDAGRRAVDRYWQTRDGRPIFGTRVIAPP
jgi:hypothetical protein